VHRGTQEPDEQQFAPGVQVRIRDEQWLVRKVDQASPGVWILEVTGVSAFVRGTEATFYTDLDRPEVLEPEHTRLVVDDSPHHRRARLYLEAVIRKTPLPQTEHGLALADAFLMEHQSHQLRPAELALSMRNPQPRILIADVVGLGKTLEIGLLLAELIRRGRGERILVVSPAHVLEQFQRELWTRFSIPLVRLDSTGIQRVQQEIPAGRNPFAYFKRVIVSVDTLKSTTYAPYLGATDWDAVVIDESHNLVNIGTRNNDLARTLARRSDALILASATPHNGDPRSFAGLIGMLDEAAIADPAAYDPKDLEHVYIRRTKTSPEVRDSLRGHWADRGPSLPVPAVASAPERAVLVELARWVAGAPTARGDQLFAWTLFKAFLSSHRALHDTIEARLKTLAKSGRTPESTALNALQQICDEVDDSSSAKLAALVGVLRELGVAPGSDVRVVVFSERIPTLRWLAEAVPPLLGFAAGGVTEKGKPWLAFGGAIQVMHGDANSVEEQKAIIDRFGIREDPVRILFTGDVASEGVNLHHQCHHLVHFDLPWSLIRIEQRNGRIDRYGQATSPEFRAILLTSDVEWRTGDDGEPLPFDDRLVGAKLLAREEQAHRIEGSAEAVTGLYRPGEEDKRLTRDLIAGRTVEASIAGSHAAGAGFLANLLSGVGADAGHGEVARAEIPTLFASPAEYFDEALRQICPTGPEDELALRRDDDGTIAFEPPPDLQHRLRALPRSYLRDNGILPTDGRPGRLRVTFSERLAQRQLEMARERSSTQWPRVGFVSPVHPVLDWLTDKALASLRHDEAFVLAADVPAPCFLVQGIHSNALGRPTVVEWMAVTGLPADPEVEAMDAAFLARCGVRPEMAGRADPPAAALQALVPSAIAAATRHLAARRHTYDERIEKVLAPYREQLQEWVQAALFGPDVVLRTEADRHILIDSLRTTGAPMLRLLAVLEPAR
jgi:Helicase conserved C-terminal domain/SNF2-related domain